MNYELKAVTTGLGFGFYVMAGNVSIKWKTRNFLNLL
jgi:hypothetical protein